VITRMMEASTEAWNRGDLQGFLLPYLDSSATTFVTSTGLLHGKAAIEARYRSSYWKDGAPADRLRFVDLEVRMLGPEHALATGRYRLFDPAGALRGEGPFSLVLVLTPDGWRIVHDHSS
jgi:beta-aspartyl-peptidase (threonine type)